MYFEYNRWKVNLLNLNITSLAKLIKYINCSSYYLNKILFYLYKENAKNIECMGLLGIITKKKLIMTCCIKSQHVNKEIISHDNTIKWSINTDEKYAIELVAIPNSKNHYTLCLSSQVGCALKCSFCSTGTQGFKKNLKPYEIINQILQSTKRISFIFKTKKITNIVVMGMGEPLLNIKNLLTAIDVIINKHAYNININKITISTSGITSYMTDLIEYKIPLALSLHASNDNLRSKLMPINKKYSITTLLKHCKIFSDSSKLTIEYIMLKNVNDSIQNALDLLTLLAEIKCKICLIPFNHFPGSLYKTSDMKSIIKFRNVLIKNGKITTIRKKLGFDVGAACGQLTSNTTI